MKKLIFTILAAAGLFFGMTANSNAGVHVGIVVGAPGYYAPGYYAPAPYYGYYGYPAYGYYGYYGPYYHGYHHGWYGHRR